MTAFLICWFAFMAYVTLCRVALALRQAKGGAA